MSAIEKLKGPVEVINEPSIPVYEYKAGPMAPPRPTQRFELGTRVSFGRARWTSNDASIFSVADGRRLAQTPPPRATYYESIRAEKIQKAQLATPTLRGFRLLPELTPGRAFLWGTVLALWGTGALVATTAKSLNILSFEDAPSVLKATFAPLAVALESNLAPLRESMAATTAAGGAVREDAQQSEFVDRIRVKLFAR